MRLICWIAGSGAVLTLELSENLEVRFGSMLGFAEDARRAPSDIKMKVFNLESPAAWEIEAASEGEPILKNFATFDHELYAVIGARAGGEVTARLHACAKFCRIVPVGDGVDPEDVNIARARILEALPKKPLFPDERDDRVLASFTLRIDPEETKEDTDQ